MDLATFAYLGAALLLLWFGANQLVRGAAGVAELAGLTPLAIGVSVVAFGTSAPEASVSVLAARSGQHEIAVGNVVGSNIFNVLFVLGLCAMLRPLAVAQQLVLRDIPIMIGVSLLLWFFAMDGRLSSIEAGTFLAGLALFSVDTLRSSRRESGEIAAEYAAGVPRGAPSWARNAAKIAVGLALLVIGARWLVASAIEIAQAAGLDETAIGLTIVAAGTSLPEVATSVVATLRGERDIAIGNVVGSSIFNVLGIIGLTGITAGEPVRISSSLVNFDIPVMIAVAIATLPLLAGDHRVPRFVGFAFLAYYAGYVTYLILAVKQHAALVQMSAIAIEFVAPLTVVAIVAYFYIRRGATRHERPL
jgi:cation:H+ antiporter